MKLKQKQIKQFAVEIKGADVEKATLEAIFSTNNKDRHGDVVEQNWDLKNFKKNPVVLNSHKYGDASEVIGKVEKAAVVDGKLQGKIKFAVNENPKAKIIFDLYANGFLNAFSVGFIPLEFDEKKGAITKSELLELSAVSVPANAMALAKAQGINIDQLYGKSNDGDDEEDDEDQDGDGDSSESGDDDDSEGEGGDDNGDDSGDDEPGAGAGAKRVKKKVVNKEFENWDDGDAEIRYKVKDIALFEEGTFSKTTYKSDMPRVFAVIAKLVGSDKLGIQSLFFPKSEGWTLDDAKKWVSGKTFEEVVVEESDNIGKSLTPNQKILQAANQIKDGRTRALTKIIAAIKLVGEHYKVETPNKEAKAENNRLLNKAVRELLKQK